MDFLEKLDMKEAVMVMSEEKKLLDCYCGGSAIYDEHIMLLTISRYICYTYCSYFNEV